MSALSKPRIAKISTQLQVRIPRDLYEQYDFGTEAEIVATPTGVEFRPRKTETEKCTDLLERLVNEGLTGSELIERFRAGAFEPDIAVEYMATETLASSRETQQ